jgi:hypothetical protein
MRDIKKRRESIFVYARFPLRTQNSATLARSRGGTSAPHDDRKNRPPVWNAASGFLPATITNATARSKAASCHVGDSIRRDADDYLRERALCLTKNVVGLLPNLRAHR